MPYKCAILLGMHCTVVIFIIFLQMYRKKIKSPKITTIFLSKAIALFPGHSQGSQVLTTILPLALFLSMGKS